MKLKVILENCGLEEKEADVYLKSLELGQSSAYNLSKQLAFPRSTCYEILEKLREKGYISLFYKKGTKIYYPEDPRIIIEKSKVSFSLFEKSLPQFDALFKTADNKPSVRFLKGKEGIKIILEEILKEASEVLVFSSEDYIKNLEEDYLANFLKRRLEKGIGIKSILRQSVEAEQRKLVSQKELREVRIISKDNDFHSFFAIWQNKVAMFSFQKEMIALVIDDQDLVKTQKAMFWLIWDSVA